MDRNAVCPLNPGWSCDNRQNAGSEVDPCENSFGSGLGMRHAATCCFDNGWSAANTTRSPRRRSDAWSRRGRFANNVSVLPYAYPYVPPDGGFNPARWHNRVTDSEQSISKGGLRASLRARPLWMLGVTIARPCRYPIFTVAWTSQSM